MAPPPESNRASAAATTGFSFELQPSGEWPALLLLRSPPPTTAARPQPAPRSVSGVGLPSPSAAAAPFPVLASLSGAWLRCEGEARRRSPAVRVPLWMLAASPSAEAVGGSGGGGGGGGGGGIGSSNHTATLSSTTSADHQASAAVEDITPPSRMTDSSNNPIQRGSDAALRLAAVAGAQLLTHAAALHRAIAQGRQSPLDDAATPPPPRSRQQQQQRLAFAGAGGPSAVVTVLDDGAGGGATAAGNNNRSSDSDSDTDTDDDDDFDNDDDDAFDDDDYFSGDGQELGGAAGAADGGGSSNSSKQQQRKRRRSPFVGVLRRVRRSLRRHHRRRQRRLQKQREAAAAAGGGGDQPHHVWQRLRLPWGHHRGRGAASDAEQQHPPHGLGRLLAPLHHLPFHLPWHRAAGSHGGDDDGHGHHSNHHHHHHPRPRTAEEEAAAHVAAGLNAERGIDLAAALAAYAAAAEADPVSHGHLCRLAKAWSDHTYAPGADDGSIAAANAKAAALADRAIALSPLSPAGHLASCVSRGRLALFSDNRTKVRLAKDARDAAERALELDPQDDLAHHLSGRWHFEMAQLNFVVRSLVRLVYGADLQPGTYGEAADAYVRAVRLNPSKLIHRVELGRTYARLGRKEAALAQLRHALKMDVDDINALLQREDAEELARGLEKELGAKGLVELEMAMREAHEAYEEVGREEAEEAREARAAAGRAALVSAHDGTLLPPPPPGSELNARMLRRQRKRVGLLPADALTEADVMEEVGEVARVAMAEAATAAEEAAAAAAAAGEEGGGGKK
jgi:tetratricopeptide (TPR) repeat protein